MTTANKPRWTYLHDMNGSTTIMNLETKETREILSNQVKNQAPSGLRRYILVETRDGHFEETGEQVPLDSALFDDLNEAFEGPNSWIYDWPHLQIEQTTDADVQRMREILEKKMEKYPYKFEIVGLQRRFLMYYSDGGINSQKYFERLIPRPTGSPYRQDGTLQGRYGAYYNSAMRDAQVPQNEAIPARYHGHSRAPCVYTGPAWVVRFRLNGVDVLLERCRMYVDDDGNFIASDWCQRMGYSTYGGGINLQLGLYTFESWIIGPCLQYNRQHGNGKAFKETTVTDVREMKLAPPPPTAAEIATQTKKLLAMAAPVEVSMLYAAREVPPITADVIEEAKLQLAKDQLASDAFAAARSRWCGVREFGSQKIDEIRSIKAGEGTLYLVPQAYTARQHQGYLQALFLIKVANQANKYRMDAVLLPMPTVATPDDAQKQVEALVQFYGMSNLNNMPVIIVPEKGAKLFGKQNTIPATYQAGGEIDKDNKAYQALLYFVEQVLNAKPVAAEAEAQVVA